MIKVIEFITSMGEGGAQSLVKDYALNINHDEFDVHVFCVFPLLESGPEKMLIHHNIYVKSVYPKYNLFWRLINKVIGRYVVSYTLGKELELFQPQVLHAHLGVLHYMVHVKKSLPKVYYTCHSVPTRTFESKEFSAACELIKTANLQLIALHEQMKDELNSLFGVNNTIVIYNGIDTCRFKTVDETKMEIRRTLNIEDGALLVGHVGRFIPEKNHVFIIKIFREVNRMEPDSKLLLVGSGPLKHSIEKIVREQGLGDNVLFLDYRCDVQRLLKAMDVFLFPSTKEGFPVSLIEAQAAGLYCIVSNSITEEAFVSPTLIPLDLASPLENWAHAVMEYKTKQHSEFDIRGFDIKESVYRIEQLYKQ